MTVLYFSKSGNTEKMAAEIAAGMNSVSGAEARAMSINAIDDAFLQESACVVLGTPIYLATMAAEVKTWLDAAAFKYKFAGKIGGAFATADYLHGGGENGIQAILGHMLVLGMLAYSGGGAFGKPVIHFGPVALKGELEKSVDTFRLYGQRMAGKASELFGK